MGMRGHMRDVCRVLTAGSATGPEPTVSYSVGSEIRCRVSRVAAKDGLGSNVPITDTEIRVPRSTTVTAADRIRVTKQDGATLGSAVDFAIVAEPLQTLAEKVLDCRRITAGSAL